MDQRRPWHQQDLRRAAFALWTARRILMNAETSVALRSHSDNTEGNRVSDFMDGQIWLTAGTFATHGRFVRLKRECHRDLTVWQAEPFVNSYTDGRKEELKWSVKRARCPIYVTECRGWCNFEPHGEIQIWKGERACRKEKRKKKGWAWVSSAKASGKKTVVHLRDCFYQICV